MSERRDSAAELSDVKFVLFGLQLSVIGTVGDGIFWVIVLGLVVSLVALLSP